MEKLDGAWELADWDDLESFAGKVKLMDLEITEFVDKPDQDKDSLKYRYHHQVDRLDIIKLNRRQRLARSIALVLHDYVTANIDE